MTTLGPWQIVCFDLDGTLVPGTSVCQHLADNMGNGGALRRLEQRYALGEISNRVVAQEDGRHFRNVPRSRVDEILESLPLIDGIADTLAAIESQGAQSILTTVTWRFAAETIARRFGSFKAVSGTEMLTNDDGTLTGEVARHFDEHDKRRFVQRHCSDSGTSLERCVAIGDSRSDLPLFEVVGFSVALNGTPEARRVAHISLETADLRDVLSVVPGLRPR